MKQTIKMFKEKNFKGLYGKFSYLISFIVLVAIALYFNPRFLRISSLSTLLANSTITGVIACGMTLVIITGLIDLSVGSIVALVAGFAIMVLNYTHSILLTLFFCLLFGLILGSVNGVLVARAGMAPFIATLATQCAYRSIITQIGQGGPFAVDKDILAKFASLTTTKLFGGSVWILPVYFILIALLTAFLLNRTKFGRYVFATGSNEHASELAGINTKRVKMVVMCYVGMLAGLSAFLLASRMSSVTASNAGNGYELDAIAAVAVGGTSMAGGRGHLIGTFFGAIMMQMISTILIAASVPPFLNGLVKGIIIVAAVVVQSINKKKA